MNPVLAPLASNVQQTVGVIRAVWPTRPRAAVILGTGLGNVANEIEVEAEFGYFDLPHFRRSTALAHRGRLLCGRLGGLPVVTMDGRCHHYEGCTYHELTFPVRVMHALGAEVLIASNASGGLNPKFAAGDIVVQDDHLDLMFRRGGLSAGCSMPRPASPMQSPYDRELAELALSVARRENFAAHRGVYVAVTGPNYETRAEYRMFRRLGGDVVGMSTVPEVETAVACGMRVLALSTVTNVARPDAPETVDAEDVVDVASHAEPNLRKIVLAVMRHERLAQQESR
ncbi:MAG: purine-nucleoside phosphorylase [Pirellulaceae bacterium]